MYIYIFFQTSKYYPSIFCSRNIHPIFPKKNQFPFHQRFNSLLRLFLPKSPDFLSKIETRKHFHWISSFKPVNTCSLSLFLPPRFCPRNDARTVTYMPIRYPSRMYRDTIRISRITQIAYVLAAYRSSSPLHSKTSNVATKRKRIIILIIILSLHISSEWE